MADLVELYARAVDLFGPRVAAIGDRWPAPTPDAEWDVRALVNHVLNENLWAPPLLDGMTIAEVGDRFDGDQLGDDPAGAWASAASASVAAVRGEGALERTVHVSFGDISGREYVGQLTCDHLIHGWDLARAIGADEALDPELVEFAYEFLAPQIEGWRSAGVFGPPVEVAAGAGRQSELLGLTGRRPDGPVTVEGGEASVVVNVSAEALWALVTDVTRTGEWSPENTGAVWLDGATGPAVGARFRGSNRRGKSKWASTCTVETADPGREFTFVAGNAAKPDTRWRYVLEPAGEGATRVTESFELVKALGATSRFITRVTIGVRDRRADLEENVRQSLARIKEIAES